MTNALDKALRLLAAGVSVIPVKPDGSKGPAVREWKGAQERAYTPAQARAAWGGTVRGLAAVCGAVSGGLECLDFDVPVLFDRWEAELGAVAPDLLARLVVVDTPEGVHCWYRSAEVEGNQKLARDPAGKTVVETRGEGGYAILPGSPLVCHPSGRAYEYRQGDLAAVATVAEGERALMLDLARALNEFAELPKGAQAPPATKPGEVSPWDDFDARGPGWQEILEPHGWRLVSGTWERGYLARPDQERKGWAASIGHVKAKSGAVLFHVFSVNAGVPVGSYGKARAWITLNHRGDYKAAAKGLRDLGYGTPRVAANGKPAEANGQPAARPWETRPAAALGGQTMTAAGLMRTELPPPRFAIEGLLCEGLNIVGGKPKAGKSILALLVSWAVAGGYPIGGRRARQGPVLYLALEDNFRRLQTRIRQLAGGSAAGWTVPELLHLRTEWPRADQGGLAHLAEWHTDHPGAGLVVIDTAAKFRRGGKPGGNSYAEDYEAFGEIQALSQHYGVPYLVNHHTRKLRAEDPFDELSGTLAISGAADGLLILDRERGPRAGGRLYLTGRDVGEATIPVTADLSDTCFRFDLGEGESGILTTGRHVSPAANKVESCMDWLREFLGQWAYPSKEIADAARAAGFSFDALKQAKARLGRDGTGELENRNFGSRGANDWWSGRGPADQWTKRPATGSNGFRPVGPADRPAGDDSEDGPGIWPG